MQFTIIIFVEADYAMSSFCKISLRDLNYDWREARSMEDKGRGRATNPLLEDDASADQSQEVMKEGITTLVGAALGEQQCWERTACKAGEYAATIPGKKITLIMKKRET